MKGEEDIKIEVLNNIIMRSVINIVGFSGLWSHLFYLVIKKGASFLRAQVSHSLKLIPITSTTTTHYNLVCKDFQIFTNCTLTFIF